MKKILLCFLVVNYFSAYTQEGRDSIVTSTKLWSMMSCGYGIENEICCCSSKYIKFEGDTLFDTIQYKRILECTDSLKENWQEIGYIRETDNKVFARKKGNLNEQLIYDFNIDLGDTIFIKNPFISVDSVFMIVTSIDSIDLINGKKKQITLSSNDYPDEYWIEGIGSSMGVINSCGFSVGGFRKILCFWNNDQLVYSNPEYEYCFNTSINTMQIWQNRIITSPNPVCDYLSFLTDVKINEPLILKIFDQQGCIIFLYILKDEYSVNLSNLDNGLYFFSLTSYDNKTYKKGKIIKQ